MEKWIIRVIVGYIIYLSFIIAIQANMRIDANAFELTEEQRIALESENTDALSTINRLLVLSTVSSSFAFINLISGILGLVFLFALVKAIKELIPALPS